MDAARAIKRKGAEEVTVIYRRAEEQMPAEKKEIEDAKAEKIEFLFQTNIVSIQGEDKVQQIECVKTKLVQKEGETRLVPVNIENSNFTMLMDYVVMAVGSKPEENITKNLGLSLSKWGRIEIDEKGRTSRPKIFAGGDIAGVKSTVAWASRSGRDAAYSIMEYLEEKNRA